MTHAEIVAAKKLRGAGRYWEAVAVQQKACALVVKALKRGELTKTPCVVCGGVVVQAHHENYDKPLQVTWLCVPHHRKRHSELRGTYDHGVWKVIGALKPVLEPLV